MCLTINRISSKKKLEELKKGVKVKKAFIVYKVLDIVNGGYKSPHRNFDYKGGYHYYQTGEQKFRVMDYYDFISKRYQIQIHEGIHAYTSLKKALKIAKAFCFGRAEVVEMVIPKGSTVYFSSNNQEVVSDNLIFYTDAKIHK